MFVQRCALLARVSVMLKTIPDDNGRERPATIERCERMTRSIMLQRLLALGQAQLAVAAEAIDLLGYPPPPPPPTLPPLTPSACIDQPDAELCVANAFAVSILHYALNLDSPSAPRSPTKGRVTFARVELTAVGGGSSVDKQDILAPSLSLRPVRR